MDRWGPIPFTNVVGNCKNGTYVLYILVNGYEKCVYDKAQTSEKLVQSFSKWCFRKKRCYTLIVEMKTNGVPKLTENQF